MKRQFLLGVAVCALAGTAVADFSRVEWIQANGRQWINTMYRPASTDRIEMKVRFTRVDDTECLYCSRTDTTKDTVTVFLIGGKLRFDRNTNTSTSTATGPVADTDYVVTANYDTLAAGFTSEEAAGSSVTMASGDYVPGSRLSLFASHTAGAALNPGTTMGNFGSYRLYYVKLFDRDGNLLRELVPAKDDDASEGDVRQYGLFDTVVKAFRPNYGTAAFTAGDTVAGDPMVEENLDCAVVDVPEGETRKLTTDEVADFGTKTLVKKGRGTLEAGDEMAAFAGDIRILDGFYKATKATAFGTAAGRTYVDGGTIVNGVSGPTDWTTDGGKPSYGDEAFVLKGTGCDNNGVIRADVGTSNFAGRGGITLDGDVLVTGNNHLEFRYGSVNANHHDIYVKMKENIPFRLVATGFWNGGNLTALSGRLGLESTTDSGSTALAYTFKPFSAFYLNNVQSVQKRRVVMEPNAYFVLNNSSATLGQVNTYSNIEGPVELTGEGPAVKLQYENKGKILTFSGPVSGTRGFCGWNGGWLQLANTNNTFTGPVAMTGISGTGDLCVTGGVSFVGPSSLPLDGGGVMLTNAQMQVRSGSSAKDICTVTSVAYPDLVAHGKCVVTTASPYAEIQLKSLRKTGDGPLTVFGRYQIAGDAVVEGGTLRFGSSVPQTPCGLNWYYEYMGSLNETALPTRTASNRGVDPNGATFGYRDWMPTTGSNGATTHNQSHWYTGYVRVPGEEGTKVTCNFVSSMSRTCRIKIGDKVCVDMRDNKDYLTGTVPSEWDRFYVGPQVELDAGWQPVFIHLHNNWSGSSGPVANTKYGWVANFGMGVDWEGRGTSNSVDYVKFLDPGDGSFLRPTLGDRSELPAKDFRPTFGGAVAFGPGTVFDINDMAPYAPVEVPSLTGVPTLRNGAVKVLSTTWTLRASDLVDAQGKALSKPLTIEATAALAFPDGPVAISLSDADAEELGAITSRCVCPVLTAAEGAALPANAFTVPPALKQKGWMLQRDGATLTLAHVPGMTLYLR